MRYALWMSIFVLQVVLDAGWRATNCSRRCRSDTRHEPRRTTPRPWQGDGYRIASGEFAPGDAGLVEKMVAAMLLEYVVMVNADPAYDRDEELVERVLRFIG